MDHEDQNEERKLRNLISAYYKRYNVDDRDCDGSNTYFLNLAKVKDIVFVIQALERSIREPHHVCHQVLRDFYFSEQSSE